MAIRVAILTISDTCSEGKRADFSGQAIEDMLPKTVFEVCEKTIVPDDYRTIASTLSRWLRRYGRNMEKRRDWQSSMAGGYHR